MVIVFAAIPWFFNLDDKILSFAIFLNTALTILHRILRKLNKYYLFGCQVQPQLPQRLTVLLLPKKPENKLKPLCPVVTDVEPQ